MSDDCGELLANTCQLLLALRERAAADASHPEELELVDTHANLPEKLFDHSLSVHASSFPRAHEGRVSAP